MIALAEKKLTYTLKQVACRADIPKDAELVELYRSINPDQNATVVVPVMLHESNDGLISVIESIPCAEYIEDAFPDNGPSLRPETPKQRNQVRMFQEIAGKWNPFGVMFCKNEDIPAKMADWAKASKHMNTALEKFGEPGGDFLLGDRFSMAEVINAPMVMRFQWLDQFRGFNAVAFQKELGNDRLAAWMVAVAARPSVKDTTNDLTLGETMLNYFKFRGATPAKVTYEVKDGNVENVKVEEA